MELFDYGEQKEIEDANNDILFLFLQSFLARSQVPKIYTFAEEIIPNFNDYDFQRHFRLSINTYHALLEELEPFLRYKDRNMGKPSTNPNKQILIYLWYVANQDSMREDSCIFGISAFTIHRCVRRVSKIMCDRLLHKFIVWPNHYEQQRISGAVADMSGVQNCIGFIDGTHIALSFIPNGDKDYINRKGFPSIQMQVVVDDRMKIIDTYVGWPGCVHDARVYRNSPLYNRLQHDNGDFLAPNMFLIGTQSFSITILL